MFVLSMYIARYFLEMFGMIVLKRTITIPKWVITRIGTIRYFKKDYFFK